MDFTLNENQQVLKDAAERFLADRYDFESRLRRLAVQPATDREMWSHFAQLGWTAILVPEAHGGLGWGLLEAAVICEEFGRGLVAEPLLEGAIVAARLLAGSGGGAAGELLAGIAGGDRLIVPALLEKGRRYRFLEPDTTARRAGGKFTLSGGKIMVAAGDAADGFLVTASIDGQTALFHVHAAEQGLMRRSFRTLDGAWAADLELSGVTADLLCEGAPASDLLPRVWDEGALCAGALALGAMERVIALSSDYIHARQQFGQPLAGFQVLQHRMADLFIQAAMARSALHGGLSALRMDAATRAQAVSAARARIDRAGLEIGNCGIHIHGGMGMTAEYPVGHYYRRLVQLARSYGDSEFHLDRYETLALAEA